jgi:hypothetical protein
MRLDHFRSMVERLAGEVPPQYLEGIAAVEVSPKTLPHPVHPHVFTLGECIPIDTGTDQVLSRVVLYHGSFSELSRERADFDWQTETWDTLLHELRHHVEWQAESDALGDYDWAAEQNFARGSGRPFDPVFYRSGERAAEGVFRVDDDVFIERTVSRSPPRQAAVTWHGRHYTVTVPEAPPPLFLSLEGLAHPPSGEVVMVFHRRPRLWDLLRRPAAVTQERARAEPVE